MLQKNFYHSVQSRAIREAGEKTAEKNNFNNSDDELQNKDSDHTAENNEARGVLDEITRKKYDSQTLDTKQFSQICKCVTS